AFDGSRESLPRKRVIVMPQRRRCHSLSRRSNLGHEVNCSEQAPPGMNRLVKTLIAALWAILFLTATVVSQQDEPPSGMDSLAGGVRDPQGQPKQGVNVSLQDKAGEHSRSIVTDTGGIYRFENVPAGTYVLRAELAGFAKATAWVSLAAGETKKV